MIGDLYVVPLATALALVAIPPGMIGDNQLIGAHEGVAFTLLSLQG